MDLEIYIYIYIHTTKVLRHIAGHADLAIGAREKSSIPNERISFFDQTKSSIHRSGQCGKRNVRSTFTSAGRAGHLSSFFITIDFLEISRLGPFSRLFILFFRI